MTTTCMHPAPSLANPSRLAHLTWQNLTALAARLIALAQNRAMSWQQTQSLSCMDAHLLRDVGAPPWLLERARFNHELDCYEHMKAMAHLKY